MKPYFGHHRTRRLERRMGQATVIGGILFFVMAMTVVAFFYEVAQNQIIMQQHDAERVTETLDAELMVTPGGNLTLWLNNRGPIPVRILRLWVIDETINNHTRYPTELSSNLEMLIPPWKDLLIHSENIYGWNSLNETHEYSIRLVTDRGNIIEPRPFMAVSGETVSGTSYPPWVSLGESELNWTQGETPLTGISNKPDEDEAYTGGKGYLSLKNTAEITFFLTFDSRVVFKSLYEIDGRIRFYSSRLIDVYTCTYDTDWSVVSHDGISIGKDSGAVYKDDIIIFAFDKPGVQGDWIPSGEYRVYLHISGYDENGNKYYQSIHYGTILIE